MTSRSAAARGRGGRSRTPSSSGGSRAPGTGPALLWTSHTGRETARQQGGRGGGVAQWGVSRAARGPRWRLCVFIRHPASRGSCTQEKAPDPSLGTQKPCLLQPDVDLVPRSNTSHLLVIFPPAVRMGLAGAPPFSHLTAASPQPSTKGRGLGHVLVPPPPRRQ